MNLNTMRWQRRVLHPRPGRLRPRYVTRLEALEDRTLLSVCTVDRLTDLGEGEKLAGDLRYCLTQAQDKDRIQFAVQGTINLTRALPQLTRSIGIEGPGTDLLTVRRDTGGFYRIFTVSSSAAVNISGLTISNGFLRLDIGGGIFNSGTLTISNSAISGNTVGGGEGSGGGIYNDRNGMLTISNSVISQNDADGGLEDGGGGIFNYGTLTISNSTISRNTVQAAADVGWGGGIYNSGAGILTISNSAISQNRAQGGGGIVNEFAGTLTVSNSTVSENEAFFVVGGIANGGTLTVSNSTITRNNAYNAGVGGIANGGTLTVSNSTITRNNAYDAGGGIFNSSGRTLHIRNTILAGNTAPSGPDLFGSLTSSGYNLIGNSSGGSGYDYKTDLLDVDPLLGPLQNNGGPTFTHALLPGSPAINSGHDEDPPEWDQRGEGFPRVVNGEIDRGAFEVQLGAAPSFGREAPGARAGQLRAADLVAALSWRRPRTDFLQGFEFPDFLLSSFSGRTDP